MMKRSDYEDEYFSDPVKLVHTAEDKTFITDERFIDAEIIDLGDILSAEEDAEYDSPQKTEAPVPIQATTSDSCRNTFLNPSVTLVDCCKIRPKKKHLIQYPDTKALENRHTKVNQEHKSEDSKTDSDLEIMDQIDSDKLKTYKNILTCLTHEIEIKKAIEQRNKRKIDIKKNTGLIGLKIKQANVDLKKSFGNSSKENTSKKQKTKTKDTIEKVSKRNIHKVTTSNLKNKEAKMSFKSNPLECTTELTKIRKNKDLKDEEKEDLTENSDKFDEEKQSDRDVNKSLMSKSTLSLKTACRDVKKSLVTNIFENDANFKERPKKVMSALTSHSEDKEHDKIHFKQKYFLEKYTNLKENAVNCGNRVMTQEKIKENERYDTEQSIVMKYTAEQSNPKNSNIVEQRSFPTLNTYTKNVLKKALKASKIPPKINPVQTSQYEKHIRSNMNSYRKGNNKLPNKEAHHDCKDLKSNNKKKSDITFKDNVGRKNMKIDSVPKSLQCQKQNTNLKSESSLRDSQNLTSNNRKIQPVNYTSSSLTKTTEMNAKEACVVKLPFPFPSIPPSLSNTSTIPPQTNAQLQHNVLNINYTRESFGNAFQSTNHHFPIAFMSPDRNNIENPRHDVFQYNKTPPHIQKQPEQSDKFYMTRHDMLFQYNKSPTPIQMQPCMDKPPPHLRGSNMHPSFPDAKMIKKSPTPPHNMNLYRSPPPNAFTPYQYFYPMTMPSVTDHSGMYTVNQNGCRVSPYTLPYDTEIFPHLPTQSLPPPPPPPPPNLSPASQQQLQQTLPNTSQLSTQDSIIGRNNGRDVKKIINISALPSTEQDVSNTEEDSKEGIVKVLVADNIQQNPKNANETIAITPTVKKSVIPPELHTIEQPNNIAVFTHSPKNYSKRLLTSQFSIRDEKKNNKPCPLSKKVKMSDSRTLPKQKQINNEPVKKGYAPAILPIPTFENILSQTRAYDMGSISDTIVEKPANKNVVFSPHHHHTEIRKISLEDYKKKNSVPSDKTKANKYRRLDKLVKNLCQK